MKNLSKLSALFLVFILALALPLAAFAGNGQGGKKQNKQNAIQNQTIEANEEALDELEGTEVEVEEIDEEIDEEEMPAWVAEKKALKQEMKAEKVVLKAEIKEAKRQIRIMRHGQIVSSDVSPVIKAGRVLVPLRALAAITGATVSWDQGSQTITIIKDGTTMQVEIGASIVYIDGIEMATDVPAELENNRTIVPLRFIAEALNLKLAWDPIEGTIDVEEPAIEEPVVEEPVVEEPATEEPATEEPATEEPATEEPATEEPATEEPATEEPAIEEPLVEAPVI